MEHWDDYWRGGGRSEQALGGKAQREFLVVHWVAAFRAFLAGRSMSVTTGARGHAPRDGAHAGSAGGDQASPLICLDIAAGSGAIEESVRPALAKDDLALRKGARDLVWVSVDGSAAAVGAARARSGCLPAACDANFLPIATGAADLVVSQFGIEYAGTTAFAEAARTLAPGGAARFICHYRTGAIEKECAANLVVLGGIDEAGVFECARDALAASYADAASARDGPQEQRLRTAYAAARRVVASAPESAAATGLSRTLDDLATLAARRLAFAPEDAFAWLTGVEASHDAYRTRMQAMVRAALGEDEVSTVVASLAAAGLVRVGARRVHFAAQDAPAAWAIDGDRPA